MLVSYVFVDSTVDVTCRLYNMVIVISVEVIRLGMTWTFIHSVKIILVIVYIKIKQPDGC